LAHLEPTRGHAPLFVRKRTIWAVIADQLKTIFGLESSIVKIIESEVQLENTVNYVRNNRIKHESQRNIEVEKITEMMYKYSNI